MSSKKKRNGGDTFATTKSIENKIFLIRGQKVILDSDLAELYDVPTKRLNEQVKRNKARFPGDFVFRLNTDEALELVKSGLMRSQIATASKRNVRYLPYAFTEHGALMSANILNSEQAVRMSVYVVRAFIRLREIFVTNQILEKRLSEIEKILLGHNASLRDLYEKIKPLLVPPPSEKTKHRIGFHSA